MRDFTKSWGVQGQAKKCQESQATTPPSAPAQCLEEMGAKRCPCSQMTGVLGKESAREGAGCGGQGCG